jgi:hypothetical protein
MEDIKKMLKDILANQAVLFKRLDKIEHKVDGGSRLAGEKSYLQELKREADKFKKVMDED